MKKYIRAIALIICIICIAALCPAVSGAAEKVKLEAISFKGLEIENFKSDTTYYLCYPSSFENISVTNIRTNVAANYTISVERYCDYDKQLTYNMKEMLTLGYGRARVTVTVTSQADETDSKSYLFALTDPHQSNYRYRYFAAATPIYETASEKGTPITTLQKGTTFSSMPLCVEVKDKWTKIVIPSSSSKHHGKIGWVKTEMLVEEYPATENAKAYISGIAALKKAHPKWTFEYRYMGTDMDDYADTIATIYKQNSGKKVSKSTVLAAMDPVSFLDEKNVFMFLDVNRYNAEDFTAEGIGALWNELKGAVCTEKQAKEYFLSAGKSLQTNTYYLTARAVLESGHGTSKLSKGIEGTDGRLYYNFYGIKAYDKNPTNGAYYAEQRGWDTPFRSIVEGGNWINDQYLQRGQNTPYFLRFYPYKNHLYMSDLEAPQKDAGNLYKCYEGAGKLDSALHFIIPIYETRYNDVPAKAWYYEDVYRATEYGLFEGMEHGGFEPESTLTRAQFVTVLSRMAGADVSKYSTTQFTDVPKKAWHAKYVAWGYKNGITTGMSETTFEPDRPIARQELCTMLVRFADGQKIEMKAGELNFTDKAAIAKWAKEGVKKCVGEGLVNGMPNGSFAPEESATRGQGAKILSLFYESHLLTTLSEE